MFDITDVYGLHLIGGQEGNDSASVFIVNRWRDHVLSMIQWLS